MMAHPNDEGDYQRGEGDAVQHGTELPETPSGSLDYTATTADSEPKARDGGRNENKGKEGLRVAHGDLRTDGIPGS
jgi:hypothetical protein